MSENPFNDRQAEFDDRQSHLKAQNDLLALKMLHEPDFMKRVPVLSPRNERELESESQGDTFDSMGSNESRKVQDGRETSIEQDGHLNASRLAQESSNSVTNEAAIQALSSEVLARVRDHLDALLPDLIASTLEEVLRDWSRDKN